MCKRKEKSKNITYITQSEKNKNFSANYIQEHKRYTIFYYSKSKPCNIEQNRLYVYSGDALNELLCRLNLIIEIRFDQIEDRNLSSYKEAELEPVILLLDEAEGIETNEDFVNLERIAKKAGLYIVVIVRET